MIINQIHKRIVKGDGGDLSAIGTPVTVQATDNFSVGDTFVGTSIIGAAPIITRVQSGFTGSFNCISADGTVGYSCTRLNASSTTALFFVKKEGGYANLQVSLPDMTGASETDYYSLNEDGTKFVYNLSNFLLIIDINKEKMTATANRIDMSSIDASDTSYSGYPFTLSGFVYAVQVRGNYIFGAIYGKYTSGSSSYNGYATAYAEITNTGLKNLCILNTNSSSSYVGAGRITEIIKYDGKDLIFFETTSGSYLQRVEILDGKIVSSNMISQKMTYITANGKYLINQKNLYRINQETGTCTSIAAYSQAIGGVDETGQYVFYNNKCYKASDTSLSTSIGTAYSTIRYYKFVDGETYLDTNKYLTTLLPTSEAEYLISHTNVVPSGGDIYGITIEAMAMGEVKEARKLLNMTNMLSLQAKTVTPTSEEQTITADSSYNGLSRVVVAGDPDLIAENIKEGVEIFGVTGTLTGSGGVEDEYTFVDYIQSTGSQYIDTGYTPNSNTRVEMSVFDVGLPACLFGCFNTWNTQTFVLLNDTKNLWAGYGTKAAWLSHISAGEHIFDFNKNILTDNGNVIATIESNEFTCNKTLFLFAENTVSSGVITFSQGVKCRYCKIYENDVLIHDYVPVIRKTDNVVGIFDKVNNVFRGNAGSGSFTGGI